ncbi:MAG: hypothetical protein ABL933_06655 [Methyloglobulus sp.]|nr:hypothetical protein [Methyloglobulus sp.]
MKKTYLFLFLGLFFVNSCGSFEGKDNTCSASVLVKTSKENTIKVESTQPIRQLFPEFFGFNLEWVPFQESLWDKKIGKMHPQLFQWLSAFPGAVYRYPGGTDSNTLQWHDTVGLAAQRPTRQFVTWMEPFTANFGVDEYLKFIKDVNGQAWYVVNIYGGVKGEAEPQQLAEQAGQLSKYLAQKKAEGLPGILRWELGNELDRAEYHWSPEKLAKTAQMAAKEIKRNDNHAQFVALVEDYPAQADVGISPSQYNRKLVKNLQDQVSEYAIHLYYDGKPGGLSVPLKLNALCDAVADAKFMMPSVKPLIWLTEHARVPPNAFVNPDWKSDWPKTGDLEAAIGVADMMIAAAQIPEVQGAFVHALHGSGGPWPLFHKDNQGNLYPGAVYWALRILRDAMLENVLPTLTSSTNNSDYDGGYDLRTVVMTDADHKKLSLWAVNRSGQALTAHLASVGMKDTKLPGKHVWISDNNIRANNYMDAKHVQPIEHPVDLVFDKAGIATITLPPYSVSTFMLNMPTH